MKRNNLLLVSVSFVLALTLAVSPFPVFAEDAPTSSETTEKSNEKSNDTSSDKSSSAKVNLTEGQREKISSSCSTYRTSLKNLQRTDSRARTYFGAIYESVATKFLTPLNLRLVKNNISSPNLISAQTSLASLRADFSSDFVTYSKSLEDLINADCRLEPEKFYAQLLDTRKKRAQVEKDVTKLNSLLSTLPKETETLISDLEKKDAEEN